jgi:alkylated DNA repair dioxygenase AlkB
MSNLPVPAPITYVPNFVQSHEEYFNRLWNELAWIDVAGPRLEYYINDFPVPYTYGKGNGQRSYDPQPMHEVIAAMRADLEKLTGSKFEVCFLNGYRDGSDQLGWHEDDSPEMDDERPIAIISLGAKREIYFRTTPGRRCPDCLGKVGMQHGPDCNREAEMEIIDDHCQTYLFQETVEKVWLESGSLCLMQPGMQDTHQHRIPKASTHNCGPRISLTFRGYVENS